jgi:lipoprotein LprA
MKLILAAVLLLAVPFAACSGDDDDDGGEATPPADAGAVLSAAAERFEALSSFHFDLEHSTGGTEIVQDLLMQEASGEVEEPNRLRADLQVDSPLGDVDVSVVAIGEQVWLDIFGDYQEIPDVSVVEIFDPNQGIPNVAANIEDATIAGSEDLGGETTDIVEGTVAAEYLAGIAPIADSGEDVTVRVWVGRETNLIHRVVVTGKIASEDPEDMVRTIELSRFDEDFNIEEPS